MLTTILTFVGLAAAEHTVQKVYDRLIDRARGDKLSRDLSEAIREWTSGLSEGCMPDTLIAVLLASPTGELGPARSILRKSLQESRLPTPEQWFDALYERWSEVRDSSPDVQPFFALEPPDAQASLRDLASRLDRVTQTDASLFQTAMIEMTRAVLESVRDRKTRTSTSEIVEKFRVSSKALLRYPSTITKDEIYIDRVEISKLVEKFASTSSSATIVLGERGAGKSSLLSRVANAACDLEWAVLAVKADLLPKSTTAESLPRSMGLDSAIYEAVEAVARERKVIALIDQVDVIAEVSDRLSDRLNILLDLIHRLSMMENVHVVLSSRDFEYRTDTRLTSLQFDEMRLDLPAFESVAAILEGAGHQPATFGSVLRELLRNPLALKVFLDVARSGDQFASLGALLDRLWSMNVTNAADSADRSALLERTAERMTAEEHLSVPLAIADDLPNALHGLLAAGLVIADERSFTFRHQTFYEFTIARRFARGNANLVSHVIERQDGLFVRPTILSTLTLLRELSPNEYERVIAALMTHPFVRSHVKALLIDFIGSQAEPTAAEVELLLPMLGDEKTGIRVLNAVAGSLGWFNLLKNDQRFRLWVCDRERAYRCLSMLSFTVHLDRLAVLALVTEHWLSDSAFDHLTAQIVRQLEPIDNLALSIAVTIVERSAPVDWLVEHVSALSASAGADLIEADLNRRVRETCKALETVFEPELIRRAFEQIVDGDPRHELFEEVATKAPVEFLRATWKRFLEIAAFVMIDMREGAITYRRSFTFDFDRGPVPEPAILTGLRIAVRSIAASSESDFLAFADQHASSDFLIVHELIVEGLEVLAPRRPRLAFEYLLGDPRRLHMGVEHERHTTSARLIAAIHGRLDPADRNRLEQAIVTFDAHPVRGDDDAEKRSAIARWNRHHRFGLLIALDRALVDDSLRRHIVAEERFFGGPLPKRHGIEMHWVGPRMKKEEIERASDDDVMNLVNRLTDDTPRTAFSSSVDRGRAGGADTLANEIGKAVEQDPDRALRLIDQLDPKKHQTYVTPLTETVIKAGVDLESVASLVERLDGRGFQSDDFRGSVGWALHQRGKNGLPDRAVSTLERWLDEMDPSESAEELRPDGQRQPIVAGYHVGFGWGKRGSVIAGYSAGILRRNDPDTLRWIDTIRRELVRDKTSGFWLMVIGQMGPCFNHDRDAANALLSDILALHPELLSTAPVLLHLGHYARALDPASLRRWLHQMKSSSSAVARQGWGELLMLQRELGEVTISDVLSGADVDSLFGLSYGATYAWAADSRRAIAAAILIHVAGEKWGADFADPIARFLREAEDSTVGPLGDATERIIRAILANRSLVEKLPTDLLAVLQPRTTSNPALTYDAARRMLEVGATLISNPADIFFAHAGDLTTIALTLHRQPAFRAAGLELFERLIELNVHEAEAALEILDRRAARRYAPRARRRIPRRRRRQPVPETNHS